jgi:diguanylate cyclase
VLADVLRREVAGRFAADSEAMRAIEAVASSAQAARSEADVERVVSALAALRDADFAPAPGDAAVNEDLMGLLRLLIDNLGALVDDDQWIGGQVQVMRQVVAQPPGPAMLAEARDRFTQIVRRQGELRASLAEAKSTLRDMIGVFVERMGEMSQSTSDYHDRIGDHARRIDASQDLSTFRGALDGLMVDMRQMQSDARRARDEVANAREQAEAAEQRIRSLETELEGVSGKLREDALTGSLNRRGLDETLAREVARAARYGNALSIGVIDIDNFKRLNDTYGHQTGDRALIHLVKIVRSLLRPTDTIGRFGGEEFVIVLPETAADAGQRALERLQRELTRQFFLANNERLLITFSGGVAQLRDGEDEQSLVARADEAMYRAKQAGKNRVLMAT